MVFFSKKIAEYWIGKASQHLKDGQPEKALAAVSHLLKFKEKKDEESQGIYGIATFFSGLAYVNLRDWANARYWLTKMEALNPPNKKWLEDLRNAVEKLEAESKEHCDIAIETMKTSLGKEGELLSKGFENLNCGMNEQAIKIFIEVMENLRRSPQIGVQELEVYNQKKSMALLGLVISYSGLGQLEIAKEYLKTLDHINPNMANEFRETWRKSPPHL